RRGKERAGQGCVLQPFEPNARSQLREPALSGQRPQPGGGCHHSLEHSLLGTHVSKPKISCLVLGLKCEISSMAASSLFSCSTCPRNCTAHRHRGRLYIVNRSMPTTLHDIGLNQHFGFSLPGGGGKGNPRIAIERMSEDDIGEIRDALKSLQGAKKKPLSLL